MSTSFKVRMVHNDSPNVEVVDELETTERGESGFGSTGVYIYNLC